MDCPGFRELLQTYFRLCQFDMINFVTTIFLFEYFIVDTAQSLYRIINLITLIKTTRSHPHPQIRDTILFFDINYITEFVY